MVCVKILIYKIFIKLFHGIMVISQYLFSKTYTLEPFISQKSLCYFAKVKQNINDKTKNN